MYSNHDLYESLIAKTNKDNTQEWLPLWMHIVRIVQKQWCILQRIGLPIQSRIQ